MATNRVQRGDILTFTAVAALSSGDAVVIGDLVGVALTDAAIGEQVEVAIEEVYNLPKADADTINIGERVHYDVSAGEVIAFGTATASGDVEDFGIAFESKGATTGETIAVKLVPGGTVQP